MQRTLDVSGAPLFVQNVFAAVGNITGEGNVNQVAAFGASSNTIGNSIIYDNGINVGIGTTNPTQKLDAAGFVKGQSGLCIGNDCRTSWPSVPPIPTLSLSNFRECSMSAVAASGACFVNGNYENTFLVPVSVGDVNGVAYCRQKTESAAQYYNSKMVFIYVGLNDNGTYNTSSYYTQQTCPRGGGACGTGPQC